MSIKSYAQAFFQKKRNAKADDAGFSAEDLKIEMIKTDDAQSGVLPKSTDEAEAGTTKGDTIQFQPK